MSEPTLFHGKLSVQQRVLPSYRAPLFDLLASRCEKGMSVFAGDPGAEEGILSAGRLSVAKVVHTRNLAPFKAHNPLYLLWQRGIHRWLESWQPEVLVLEANSRYLSNRYAVWWMHARGKKVLGWGLGSPDIHGGGIYHAVRRWERSSYLRSLDGMIAYSKRGAEEYRRLGFPKDRVWVALNAADPRPLTMPPARPSMYQGRPLVLYVGRLQKRKRIDNLLKACAAVENTYQPRLMIVGDGPERGELESFARDVYPQAEFMGDRRGPELEMCFLQADLFVLPGTGGLAVQQAMRRALPVIVAEGDGTQDDLVRPENGWRVRPGDLEDLTAALREALSSAPRLRKMGLESYRIVVEEANLEAMVDVFVNAAGQLREPSEGGR